MTMQRNHYEVLGVPKEATTDQIKKKYRELARKWHPDVVKDKDLGRRVFSQINQAYRILADPERRALYNATLNSSSNGTANGTAAQAQTPPAARYQNGTAPQAQAAARPQNGTAPQTRAAEPQAQMPTAQKAQAIAGLLGNADNAIMAGKPVEARAFCVKVLEIDPRNLRALEILGDALDQMGQREEAAVQYRKALQMAPSHKIQAKLTRVEQAGPSTRTNPPGQMASSGQGKPPTPPPAPSSTNPLPSVTEKAGGLFGRLLGRK